MSFEVLDVSPPALTSIEADEVLSFDVRGTDPFGLTTLAVKFPRSVTRELVFCADPALSTGFEEAYSGSTVVPVVDGSYVRWRFTLRRNNLAFSPENPDEPQFKWPGTPTLSIISEGGSTVVGPAGPQGPAGARGSAGTPGRRGAKGQRGKPFRLAPQRIPDQSVLGNIAGGVSVALPIPVGTNTVLGRAAGVLGAAALVDSQIATNTISAASQAQMAANTLKANATGGIANEANFAVVTNSVVGRVAGNLVSAPLVDAQVDAAAAIAISKLANAAANTIDGNWTGGTAAHTDNAVGTNTVVGRVAGNIVAAALVDAQISASAAIQLSKLATQGANTVVVNATASSAVPTALTIGTNSVLGRVAGNIVAAQLVDAQITTNTISNASRAQMVANTIKANATAATANEADLSVGTNTVVGRVAGNIVAAALVDAQITTNTISAASQAQMGANTIKANATAGTANEANLSVGTNSVVGRVAGNIVAAPLVDAQVDAAAAIVLSKLASAAANTLTGNWTAGSAAHTDNAVGTNTVVGRVAGNIVAAALVDAQVDAAAAIVLSKLANAAANTLTGNWTAGSAAHTDNSVGTNTVVGRVAGNIVAAQLVDAQITTNTISNASRTQMATNTIKANATAGTANEADLSVGTNTVVGRVAGNIVAAPLVDAQIDAAAGIQLSKLASQAANTVVANATGSSAVPTAFSVGTNSVLGRVAGNLVAAALVNAQVDAAAAIDLSKLANGAALSVVGRSANSSGAHADITAVAASDAVLRESGSTVGFGTVAAGGLANAIISPAKLALLASSIGATFVLYASFAAGAGGSADDVTVYNTNAPFAFRILKTLPYVSTAVSTFSIQARDTAGGVGAALSSEFDAGTATESPAIITPIFATTTVAANGSLFIRRTDSGIAGEMVFLCVRT